MRCLDDSRCESPEGERKQEKEIRELIAHHCIGVNVLSSLPTRTYMRQVKPEQRANPTLSCLLCGTQMNVIYRGRMHTWIWNPPYLNAQIRAGFGNKSVSHSVSPQSPHVPNEIYAEYGVV